jgi:hypothetical protein
VFLIYIFSIVDVIGAGGWQHHKMVKEGSCSVYSSTVLLHMFTPDNCLRYLTVPHASG